MLGVANIQPHVRLKTNGLQPRMKSDGLQPNEKKRLHENEQQKTLGQWRNGRMRLRLLQSCWKERSSTLVNPAHSVSMAAGTEHTRVNF